MSNTIKQKKIDRIWLFCLLFIIIFFPQTIEGTQYPNLTYNKIIQPIEKQIIYVDDDNVNGPWYGTLEHPFRSIRSGIEYAFNGDTVFVFNGTYKEGSIQIYHSINLIGENRNTTIYDGYGGDYAFDIVNNNVNIHGFTIKNAQFGILIDTSNNTVTDTIIIQCRVGIRFWLNASNNNFVCGNIIENSGEVGLILWWSCNNNNVSNNIIRNWNEGIRLVGSQHSNIVGNNYFENNSVGVNIWDDVQQGNIYDNVFFNNSCGINLDGGYSLNIIGNTFVNNSNGITSRKTNYNNISGNTFQNNTNAISLIGYKNAINKNNFIMNNCDASFTYYQIGEKNYWSHNYWGRPRFLPKLIRGTLLIHRIWDPWYPPEYYELHWLNVDWFPAQDPYNIPGMS